MRIYLRLLERILEKGHSRPDRTGVGTRSLFGEQLRFDLAEGFPLLTTKKVHFPSILHELIWFLRADGDLNVEYLQAHSVRIWDEWADEKGNLGPIYGAQWNKWRAADGATHNQLQFVLNEIKTNPYSRRLIVSSWNVGELSKMRLLPCHALFQFYVTSDGRLSCQLYQRSADVFLGLPFNIASYALLTMIIAQLSGLKPGELVLSLGDAHLYNNHVEQARLQLHRSPYSLPEMRIQQGIEALRAFEYAHFQLLNYQHHPPIKAPVAV